MIYVLLTRAPLYRGRSPFSCDLHVLGAPLTFVLSQDQTLQLNPVGQRNETYCSLTRRQFLSLVDIVHLGSRVRGIRSELCTCPGTRDVYRRFA